MISIICVFNDQKFLERRLLKSLKTQNTNYEFIPVDNTENKFDNAAKALNYGAKQANGDFLLFAHQDIELLSPKWLVDAESLLQKQNSLGWVGVAGCSKTGEFKGFLLDREFLFGLPGENLQEVQTLDECVLIHENTNQEKYFDEEIPGWHAYGVDACCNAISDGKHNFVLPLKTWHDSRSTNLQNLDVSHRYVWEKHKDKIARIYTTCGLLPYPTWMDVAKPAAPFKERIRYLLANKLTERKVFRLGLEELTEQFKIIHCLHEETNFPDVQVASFCETPYNKRKIVHQFRAFDLKSVSDGCLVFAPDLTEDVVRDWSNISRQINSGIEVFVCIYLEQALRHPIGLYDLLTNSTGKSFFINENGKTIIVAHFKK